MLNIPDAPDIRRTEATGYPHEDKSPICPVCGETCDTIYRGKDGDAVGCNKCVEAVDAWDLLYD